MSATTGQAAPCTSTGPPLQRSAAASSTSVGQCPSQAVFIRGRTRPPEVAAADSGQVSLQRASDYRIFCIRVG
jgi:hypothetical protein